MADRRNDQCLCSNNRMSLTLLIWSGIRLNCRNLINMEMCAPTHNYYDMYMCKTCSKCFNQRGVLNQHMKAHEIRQPHKPPRPGRLEDVVSYPTVCQVCGLKSIPDAAGLTKHLITHISIDKPYQCDLCYRRFATQNMLKLHMTTHYEIPHHCEVCQSATCTKSLLACNLDLNYIRRLKRTLNDDSETPDKCNNKSVSMCGMSRTSCPDASSTLPKLVKIPMPTLYQCNQCHGFYNSKGNLKLHMATHELLQCEVCQAFFAEEFTLSQHMMSHTKPYQCQKCKKIFICEFYLQGHTCTPKVAYIPRLYECGECNRFYKAKFKLKQHMATHEICQYEEYQEYFLNLFRLSRHRKIHAGVKPYQCGVGDRCFTAPSTLKLHMTVHDEIPHQCKVCQKGFLEELALSQHMMLHTKSYQCPTCLNDFTRELYLQRHTCTLNNNSEMQIREIIYICPQYTIEKIGNNSTVQEIQVLRVKYLY